MECGEERREVGEGWGAAAEVDGFEWAGEAEGGKCRGEGTDVGIAFILGCAGARMQGAIGAFAAAEGEVDVEVFYLNHAFKALTRLSFSHGKMSRAKWP